MEFGMINLWGAIIVGVLLIPNIIFAVKNPGMENKCNNRLMNTVEQVGRYGCMFLMIVPVAVQKFGFAGVLEMLMYISGAVLLLLAYLLVWVFYFKAQSRGKAITLAVLPTVLFLLCGVLLRHWLLVAFAVLFGAGHIFVTLKNNKR